MSSNRQTIAAPKIGPEAIVVRRVDQHQGPEAIVVRRIDMRQGHRIEKHVHTEQHQLVWAPTGVLTVDIGDDSWVLPPTLALWVPVGTAHVTSATRPSVLQGIYLSTQACPISWTVPTVVAVGELLRSLLLHLEGGDFEPNVRSRAEAVVFDLLAPVSVTTIAIPMPTDPRAHAIAIGLLATPADERTLEAWGHEVGASTRTLTRLFRVETGLSFGQWRTHIRLRAALHLLAAGDSVSTVAHTVGYETASAFVASFRRTTGQTPGAYLASATTVDLPSSVSRDSRAASRVIRVQP